MINLQKSRSDGGLNFDEKELDRLFDIPLRPLKSKNARTIFKILVEELNSGYLTTLDLQTRLGKIGINLNKKEINGWLRSLQNSGLISKKDERGKPTTIEYDDKYTFDMWSLTFQGMHIAEGLNNLLKEAEPKSFNLEKWLRALTQKDRDAKKRMLTDLEEAYIQIASLRALWMERSSLTTADLREKVTPTISVLERHFLSRPDHIILRQDKRTIYNSLLTRFMRVLGLSSKEGNVVHLTEEGQKFAEKLWPRK